MKCKVCGERGVHARGVRLWEMARAEGRNHL